MISGEYCGERMMPATRVTPRDARSRRAASMVGSEKRIPGATGTSPSSAVSSASAWARVMATSGEPPITA